MTNEGKAKGGREEGFDLQQGDGGWQTILSIVFKFCRLPTNIGKAKGGREEQDLHSTWGIIKEDYHLS